MKPHEAAVRVVMIEEAHAMNAESANALLKILEEPPDRTVFILTAADPGDLPSTIVSRCRHLRFHPVSRHALAALWHEKYAIPPEEAMILAGLADGGLCRIDMNRPEERHKWIRRRSWILASVAELMTLKGQDLSLSGLLAAAERLSRTKALVDGTLDIIRSWLRDLIVYKHCPEKILNADQLSVIQRISQKFSEKSLLAKIEAVDAAGRDLRTNANIRLSLEVLILRLAKK